MAALRSENRALKGILTDRLGGKSKQIISDCTTELSRQVVAGRIGEDDEETVTADMAAAGGGDAGGSRSCDGGGGKGARRDLSRPDYRLMKSLQTVRSKRGGLPVCCGSSGQTIISVCVLMSSVPRSL